MRAPRMNLENILLSEISPSQNYQDVQLYLDGALRVVTLIDRESPMAVARGHGEGTMGSWCFHGDSVSVLQQENLGGTWG